MIWDQDEVSSILTTLTIIFLQKPRSVRNVIVERLRGDLTEAIRAKNEFDKDILRLTIAALDNERIKLKRDLTEQETQAIIQREIKQTNERREFAIKAGDSDLNYKCEVGISVLMRYLPKQMSMGEIQAFVKEKIQAMNSPTKSMVLKTVMPELKGKADGNLVRMVVESILDY